MPQSDYPILRVEISRASKSFKHPLLTRKRANLTQECSNHHISLSTLRSKGLSCRKMKWSAIYTNLTVNAIVRQSHPWSADSQGQERFSALPADEKTLNYNTKVLKPPSLPIKMIWWAIYIKLPVNAIVRLPRPRNGDSQSQEAFLAPPADKHTCNYDTRVLEQPSLPIKPKIKGIDP